MAGKKTGSRRLTAAQADTLLRKARSALAKEVEGVKVVKSEPKKADFSFVYRIDVMRSLKIDISITPIMHGRFVAQLVPSPGPRP